RQSARAGFWCSPTATISKRDIWNAGARWATSGPLIF
ncbi:uncharacterized protein METZ01_LOCUS182988, partial [marine metagenome]